MVGGGGGAHPCTLPLNPPLKEDRKICSFSNTKDKKPPLSQLNVVYEFTCPGCSSLHIGKTNRTLLVRIQVHSITDKESALY